MKYVNLNKFFLTCLIIFSCLFTKSGIGQRISVPIDIQMKLLPKILSLNNSYFEGEKIIQINVGVFYSSQSRSSIELKQEIFDNYTNQFIEIETLKIKYIPIDISQSSNYKKLIHQNNIQVAFINPIRAFDVSKLTDLCKEEKVLTFSSTPEYYDEGISVYFDVVNNKPKIFINLDIAKQEGAKFSSHLLKVSIVRGTL